MKAWEIVVGLEIHAQLSTKSKVFCACATSFGAQPNEHTCPVCLGLPGALPVLSIEALQKTMRVAKATECTISREIRFDRKNYFYPDLPKAYQITQFHRPLGTNGRLSIVLDEAGTEKIVRIEEMHLEEDAGKLIHIEGRNETFVDLNRAGTPLLEIVSAPDLRSADEAVIYFKKIKSILEYVSASNCNMERGDLRCDANVSVRPKGSSTLGNRCELKNMNTFKGLHSAIECEAKRQIAVLESGGVVQSKTMTFDPVKMKTYPLRDKEDAAGYRYFPEPDLVAFAIDEAFIEENTKGMPELPEPRKKRFVSQFSLTPYDAATLVGNRALADYYETALSHYDKEPKKLCNWIITELTSYLNGTGKDIGASPISPKQMAELTQMIAEGEITGKMGKEVFSHMVETRKDPRVLVKEMGLEVISDTSAIEKIVEDILVKNPESVEQYKKGSDKVLGFFVGQVMKQTRGQGNPQIINEILRRKLT